ncbi:hypothetical protein N781_15815 [Pontibacillus halophilus JSM 076056 = DSM 19796]|uniref:Lipoprotein n=1 Tax=Pontibacillus halophilus JSM 076056 = DSM 19796 TaxID=1385510 RepID=A0A0A5GL76_9BACI|nr:hypothetical protein [Pontibacillus halophilus]KGX92759.1 hypothetical protein N781_15815 [Pontibacillus halophilus JSM 076056 = DSM 19796]
MNMKNKKSWLFGLLASLFLVAFATGCTESQGQEEQEEPDTEEATTEPEANEANETEDANEEVETDQQVEEETEEAEQPTEESVEEPAEETTEETPAENNTVTVGTGMLEVGKDIEPGLYKHEGGVFYWERLSGFSGEFEEIIANGNPQGQTYVEIKDTDVAFNSEGSGDWVKIDDSYSPQPVTTFGDGSYIVGKDIEPGRYKSTGGDGFGYWARLSGFSEELDDIITNGNPSGATIVEIKATDYGFQTFGSGEWTKME